MTGIRETKMFICDEVFRGCAHKSYGSDDTEVLIQTARHLRMEHGLREISAELLGKIRAAIHSGSAAAC